jgi:dihydropteroate synthase
MQKLYLRPLDLHWGIAGDALLRHGQALPLLGGSASCTLLEAVLWDGEAEPSRTLLRPDGLAAWREGLEAPLQERADELLALLQSPRPAPWSRPRIMGILNVTPDSFSEKGEHVTPQAALAHGLKLAREGADILDVGGESTRPGARLVPVEEELRRVLPVVEGLVQEGIAVSIDSRKAAVMREAAKAGAAILNDVSGLTFDPDAPAAAAATGAMVVLMHMRGLPATMNQAPSYRQCALEVFDELEARILKAEAAGIPRQRLILDPGLCFAKHEPHNLDVLRNLTLYHGLGCPLMVGLSRKGWAAWIQERHRPKERLFASLAAAQWALERGAALLRVHDVAATRQMLDAWLTLRGAMPCP